MPKYPSFALPLRVETQHRLGMHAPLEFEARRQRECMAHSIPIIQETRRWDGEALEAFVDQAIAANPGPVADFKAGKKAAAGFFVGQVMKLSKSKADPKIVDKLVAQKLATC